jgi:hypothetical protein
MVENPQKLMQERVTRLLTTLSLNEPDRVPICFGTETWIASNAGFTVQEIAYDYSKLISACEKVIEEYQWDAYWPPLGIWPAPVFDAVGQSQYAIAGSDIDPASAYQWPDSSPMTVEDYPKFIADPLNFIFEEMMPKRSKELAKPWPRNSVALAKGALAFGMYLATMGGAFAKWAEVYGMPVLLSGLSDPPMDYLADHFRGFNGIMMDIKRNPDEVVAACEAMYPLALRCVMTSFGGPPAKFPWVFLPLHVPTYLRPVDFEKFYWPTFSRLINDIADNGYNCLLFLEGDWEPYFSFLAQLPKGHVTGLIEQKIIEAKKTIGDSICLAGGLDVDLLGYGTPDQCVAETKKVIDACAPGGGFILSGGKALLSPNDAKPENLQAVTKFAMEYGVYHD